MCFKIKEIYMVEADDENVMKDYLNYNTDIIAVVEEEDDHGVQQQAKYVASFFTFSNVFNLKLKHKQTGEFLNGLYFFSKNMVLIEECSTNAVNAVIQHLVEEGEFKDVFRKL